jgi:hypothetical protein
MSYDGLIPVPPHLWHLTILSPFLRVPFPSQFLQGFFLSSLLLRTISSRSIMALCNGSQMGAKTKRQHTSVLDLLAAEDRYRRSARTTSSLALRNPRFRLTVHWLHRCASAVTHGHKASLDARLRTIDRRAKLGSLAVLLCRTLMTREDLSRERALRRSG